MFHKLINFIKNTSLVFKLSASILLTILIGSFLLSIFISNYSKPLLKEQVISAAYKALGEVNHNIAQGADIAEQSLVNTARILELKNNVSDDELELLAQAGLESITEQYGHFYEFFIYVFPKNGELSNGVFYHSYIKNNEMHTLNWKETGFAQDREWLKYALKTGKIHWTEPYMAEDKNDEVNIPEGESQNVAQTPDFTYWVAYPEDADKAELLRQLIDRLYAVLGIEKAWSTLEGMHFELETDLEETAYHFRTERIREFGFMPRDEAAALFANVNVEKEAENIRKNISAELYIQPYPATSKLETALAKVDDTPAGDSYFARILSQIPNLEPIRIQLLSIAQQIATFDGYQPHEDQGFDDSMLLAVSYANIGLEYTSQHEDEVAKRILIHTPLKKLVTLGYSLTLELQRKAQILVSRGHLSIIEDQKMSLLTTSQRDAIEGLLIDRPRPGSSALTPFISMNDIKEAAAVIADVATRELFFGEALHKQRDDISLLAYTHELVHGVENIFFDNVAITWLTRKALKCEEPWDVFMTDDLPSRDVVIEAIQPKNILSLFKSSLPSSTVAALTRFAHQLKAFVDESWPESQKYPDPKLVNVIVIAERDE